MCEVASGLDGDEFLDALDLPATYRGVAHLDAMLAQAAAGEPLQYVLGRWGFRHLDLMVDRRVLIPTSRDRDRRRARAWTRARSLPSPIICADLGTGSGAIGLSLAAELPLDGVTVWMTDVSPDALDVARANAAGIGRAGANVRLAEGIGSARSRRSSAADWRWSCRTHRMSATMTPSWNRSCATGNRSVRCSVVPTVSMRSGTS